MDNTMYKIDREIIDKAKDYCAKCWCDCLSSNLSRSCKPIQLNDNYLIIEPTGVFHGVPCTSCLKVDSVYVCLCPLRKEIFRKYNQ